MVPIQLKIVQSGEQKVIKVSKEAFWYELEGKQIRKKVAINGFRLSYFRIP